MRGRAATPHVPGRGAGVLIVDDDATTRRALALVVSQSGWSPIAVDNGEAALHMLGDPMGPRIALIDWMMPTLTGPDLCQSIRASESPLPPYLILVTVRSESADIVAGLDAGADDYLVKPIDIAELRARVRVGLRTLELRERLAHRARELEMALAEVRQLRSLLPTCSYCRRIRDEGSGWQSLEEYVSHHTDTRFSHGFCPDCFSRYVQPQLEGRYDSQAAGPRD
jgi:phosphoserine phosphatase RsbU/P